MFLFDLLLLLLLLDQNVAAFLTAGSQSVHDRHWHELGESPAKNKNSFQTPSFCLEARRHGSYRQLV